MKREDPELYKSIKPWSKITEVEPLRALLLECGVSSPEISAEPGTHPLHTAEEWWTIILGSGYRSTVNSLSPESRDRVRQATMEEVTRAQIREIRTDVIYALARRPTDT